MKKLAGFTALLFGLLLAKALSSGSIAVMGGADGPTAVYRAYKISPESKQTAMGIFLASLLLWLILPSKEKSKGVTP